MSDHIEGRFVFDPHDAEAVATLRFGDGTVVRFALDAGAVSRLIADGAQWLAARAEREAA